MNKITIYGYDGEIRMTKAVAKKITEEYKELDGAYLCKPVKLITDDDIRELAKEV